MPMIALLGHPWFHLRFWCSCVGIQLRAEWQVGGGRRHLGEAASKYWAFGTAPRKSSKITTSRNDTHYLLDIAREAASEERIGWPFAGRRLFLGASAFTADGWQGTCYPVGMRRVDYLKFYTGGAAIGVEVAGGWPTHRGSLRGRRDWYFLRLSSLQSMGSIRIKSPPTFRR
jgi:hypothetical protein